MKKTIIIMALMVANVAMNANKTIETRANNVVYFVEGSNEYHTTAFSASIHSHSEGKMMMQRENGCKNAGMHECILCKGAKLIANMK